MSAAVNVGKQVQEQTQIIATAIGKPIAKAPTIVKVNAESRFGSGRTLSIDMPLTPHADKSKRAATATDAVTTRIHVQKVRFDAARTWLTKG